jgi:hypothetical protein
MTVGTDSGSRLAEWLSPFRNLFTRPTWQRVLVLIEGAVLTPHRRTVSAALRAAGKDEQADFARYHAVLNRCRWSALAAARVLFILLIDRFAAAGPVVIGLDDTIERRWGARIKARGIYRDPVRSSHGHFVKASGLRWLSAMALVPLPWAGRVWALPFLTVLVPSERSAPERGTRHKTLIDCARQMLLQVARWLPNRRIVAVGDSGFSAIDLLDVVRTRICMVTRLRLDARLFAPATPREAGTIGRPRRTGGRLPTLAQRLVDPRTMWQMLVIAGWYGEADRRVEVATGIAVWSHPGRPVVPLRWLLVRDPTGTFKPQAFLCTDHDACPRTFYPGSFGAGPLRSPSLKSDGISALRRSVNGPIRRLREQRPCCSASSVSSRSGLMICIAPRPSSYDPPVGTAKGTSPSATPWPPSDARSGLTWLYQSPRPAQRTQKDRAKSTIGSLSSPATPPKGAKSS